MGVLVSVFVEFRRYVFYYFFSFGRGLDRGRYFDVIY